MGFPEETLPACTSLEYVLTEAAAFRRLRRLEQLAAQAADVRGGGSVGDGTIARCAYAMLELERLAGARSVTHVDLGGLLNRAATLVQLATPGGSTMATRLAGAEVPLAFGRGIAAAVLDLFHVVRPTGDVSRPEMMLATAIDRGDLVVTVAAPPGMAVPDAPAARSMDRAARIARLLGGEVARGIDGGRHLAGLVCPLPGAGVERCP